jgi:hypothetical protein
MYRAHILLPLGRPVDESHMEEKKRVFIVKIIRIAQI